MKPNTTHDTEYALLTIKMVAQTSCSGNAFLQQFKKNRNKINWCLRYV